jgi:probable HAF family extracellular repeat protein
MIRGFSQRSARRARPAIAALAWLGTAEGAPPQGTPLLIELPPEVLATTQGANGFVVAGNLYSGGGFHWMPTSGVTGIGGASVAGLSHDAKTLVGVALDPGGLQQAAIWTGGKNWRLLGSVRPNARPCDALLSSAFGTNDDGRVIVGLAWDDCSYARAFRWEESTGMVDLGSLAGGGQSTRANGVSGDGRVVVGWEEAASGFRQGAKWVDGKEELIQGPAGPAGEARAANRDGSLIVGMNCQPLGGLARPAAWTWTKGAGVTCFPVERPPGFAPGSYQVIMQATSDDGRVTGGSLSFGLDAESVVWFDGEPAMLRDYLRDHGIPDAFEGWVNTGFITDISPDGRTLVGYGAGATTFQGFVVVLPELSAKK